MIRSTDAQGKYGTAAIDVVARWISIAAIWHCTYAGGALASKIFLEMIRSIDA
jgi:hypothetical protein